MFTDSKLCSGIPGLLWFFTAPLRTAWQIVGYLQKGLKNFQRVFCHDESVSAALLLPEMCTKISTKKILMPEDFLPLVAKQGQTITVQGQTNKYLEGRGNAHLITYSFHTYINTYINVCIIFPLFWEVNFFFFLSWKPKQGVHPVSFSCGWECCCQLFQPSFPPLPQCRGIICLFTGAHCALS